MISVAFAINRAFVASSRLAGRVIDRAGSLKRPVTAAFRAAAVVAGLGIGILFSQPAAAEPVRVIDGDGIELAGQSVRLWGIDAPELRQECSADGRRYPCGEKAKEALTAFLRAAAPICETVNRDRFGRQVARCEVSGEDVAALMVRSGWAVDWPRYSKGAYAADQDAAEAAGRGLWAGFFAAPWEWRKEH